MRLLLKPLRLRFRDVLLLVEAFASLVAFRVCLLVFPVRKIVGWVGAPTAVPLQHRASIIHRVQWAIEAVSRHSPVEFVCFPQALSGLWMLRRRKIPSKLIYGVAKSEANKLIAHTWLEVDGQIIVGGEVAPRFTAVNLEQK